MRIAKVIPLTRLPRHLSVFDYSIPDEFVDRVRIGSIVRIPLRNNELFGIVESIKQQSATSLKSIASCSKGWRISAHDLELIRWFSRYYAVSLSLPALMMIPPAFARLRFADNSAPPPMRSQAIPQKPLLMRLSSRESMVSHYREAVHASADIAGQVLLLCPTIADASFTASRLASDFQKSMAIIHSGLSKTQVANELQRIAGCDATFIIGTRMTCLASIPNLSTIIVDQAERIDHKNYDMNPRYDARDVALQRTLLEGATCSFVSVAPRVEDYYRVQKKLFIFEEPRSPHTNNIGVGINLSDECKGGATNLISDKLQEKIRSTIERNKTVFLFLNKKGGEKYIVCKGCGNLIAYLQTIIPANNTLPLNCSECGSMTFAAKGIGTTTIAREVRKLFPETPCLEISKDTRPVRSHAPAKGVSLSDRGAATSNVASISINQASLSLQSPSIIVGTSLVPIAYPKHFAEFGLIGMICADPVVTTVDFRSQEHQWQALLSIISLVTDTTDILIQAFHPEATFIQTLLKNDYVTFVEKELAGRKTFAWPPYSKMINIKAHNAEELENVRREFSTVFGFLIQTKKISICPSITIANTLAIQIFEDASPDELETQLLSFFSKLPTNAFLDMNPL